MNLKDRFKHWKRKIKFNSQYKRGKWAKLASEHESVRYKQINEYLEEYKPKTILDLGCGDGVLNRRMIYDGYDYFLGIDYAKVSINQAKAQNFQKAEFETHDLLDFKPSQKFDAIILNEAFYYIHDSRRSDVVTTILDHLSNDGVLIVSIFREGNTCWEYFKDNPKLKEVSFNTVHSKAGTTYWKVGLYQLA
jgi:2-polyprenyl-3-methyl-5-hydroxy-6-metoxy-1,4-benzoquinol methylase